MIKLSRQQVAHQCCVGDLLIIGSKGIAMLKEDRGVEMQRRDD
jgi:hypothetical protein